MFIFFVKPWGSWIAYNSKDLQLITGEIKIAFEAKRSDTKKWITVIEDKFKIGTDLFHIKNFPLNRDKEWQILYPSVYNNRNHTD